MTIFPTLPHHLFDQYTAPSGVYDEFVDEQGGFREHLRPFIQAAHRLDEEDYAHRWQQAERLIHQNGFAYGGHLSPSNQTRPWELDAVPLIISSDEWNTVSSALAQRARLLNRVLQDLYGEQRLLREGVLPPELVYGHPSFLRPCHGQTPPNQCFLHFYAADLARDPQGNWQVLSDRTEAPSGVGRNDDLCDP